MCKCLHTQYNLESRHFHAMDIDASSHKSKPSGHPPLPTLSIHPIHSPIHACIPTHLYHFCIVIAVPFLIGQFMTTNSDSCTFVSMNFFFFFLSH